MIKQIFVCISSCFCRLFHMLSINTSIPKNSFWQSDIWKRILSDSHQCESIEMIQISWGMVFLEVRKIGMGFFGGFILWTIFDLTEEDIKIISEFSKKKECLFFQMEPLFGNISPKWFNPYRYFLEPYTRIIDLTQSEDEILWNMHEKGRYNIRLSQKRWVHTRWVEHTPENIKIWMELLADTTSRDGFFQNSQTYYEVFLSEISLSNKGWLLFAYYNEKPIAAGIFVYYEDQAIYYYGASVSDRDLRKHMAPYLIQWEALLEGKRRGCCSYDFLGIAHPDDPASHLRWVSEFKEKFGGQVRKLPEKKLFVISWKYWLFLSVRNIKKIFSK